MAVMISAGCDIPQGLRYAAQATNSERMAQEADLLAERTETGVNILEAGQFCHTIPRLFLYSMQLGMQRNELLDNLHHLSTMYATQARQGQSRLNSVLMPMMIILVGGIIMMTVLSIFLPMIQVITSLSAS